MLAIAVGLALASPALAEPAAAAMGPAGAAAVSGADGKSAALVGGPPAVRSAIGEVHGLYLPCETHLFAP